MHAVPSCSSSGVGSGSGLGWSKWYDRDDESGTGDWESFGSLVNPPCDGTTPTDARCERVSDGKPADQTGQVFHKPCGVDGLVCKNSDNAPGGCDDYQVSYKCKGSSDDGSMVACTEDLKAVGGSRINTTTNDARHPPLTTHHPPLAIPTSAPMRVNGYHATLTITVSSSPARLNGRTRHQHAPTHATPTGA